MSSRLHYCHVRIIWIQIRLLPMASNHPPLRQVPRHLQTTRMERELAQQVSFHRYRFRQTRRYQRLSLSSSDSSSPAVHSFRPWLVHKISTRILSLTKVSNSLYSSAVSYALSACLSKTTMVVELTMIRLPRCSKLYGILKLLSAAEAFTNI